MSRSLVPSRRFLRTCIPRLFYRQSSSRSSSLGNAVVRGLVIGAAAAGTLSLAGYTVYHVSGAKKLVDRAQTAMALLGKSTDNLSRGAFGQALKYLREAAKAYVAAVPLAGFFVDKAFDAAEDVAATHSTEANAIITKAVNEISTIIREQGNEHMTRGAIQVVAAARRFLREMLALGAKAGQPLSERLDLETRVPQAAARATATLESVKSQANEIFGNKNKKSQANEIFGNKNKLANVVDDEPSTPSTLEETKDKAWNIFSRLKPKTTVESRTVTESSMANGSSDRDKSQGTTSGQ